MQKVGFNFFATEKAVQEVLRIAQENNITEPDYIRVKVIKAPNRGQQRSSTRERATATTGT